MHHLYIAFIVTLCCVIWPITLVSIAVWIKNPPPLFRGMSLRQKRVFTTVFATMITLMIFLEIVTHGRLIEFRAPFDWVSFAMFSLILGSVGMLGAGLLSLPITAGICESLSKDDHAN